MALAAPAAARAAYAPKLAVKLDPATFGEAPAMTTTITQANGETASKTVRLKVPVGFGPPRETPKLGTCTPAQEQNRACPADSQLGTAAASTQFGQFKGTVHYGGASGGAVKVIVFLSNGLSLLDQTIEGTVTIGADGITTVFDNLPDVLTTSFTLALDGGPKSLLSNPRTCGEFKFEAAFTSQKGEQATSSAPVEISGCPPPDPAPPALGGVTLRPAKLTAGRTSALRFTLDQPANVRVTVKRLSDRRRVADRTITVPAGTSTVKGIGRGLAPGRYRVEVRAFVTGRPTALRRVSLRIVKPAKR